MQKNILLFDVESTTLHGTGFAVGAIVVNRKGEEIDRFELLSQEGAKKANDWVYQKDLVLHFALPNHLLF